MIVILFVLSSALSGLYNRAASRPTPLVIMLYVVVSLFSPLLFRDGIVTAAFFVLSASIPAVLLFKLGKVGLAVERRPRALVAAAGSRAPAGLERDMTASPLAEAVRLPGC
jgi:hypothetical protein